MARKKTTKGQAKAKIDKMFKQIKSDITINSEHRMNRLARDILKKAISYAPVDTGYLIGSGFINKPQSGNFLSQGNYVVRVGFRAHYAQFQEENHRTKSKYLERARNEVLGSSKLDSLGEHRPRATRQNIKRIVINV